MSFATETCFASLVVAHCLTDWRYRAGNRETVPRLPARCSRRTSAHASSTRLHNRSPRRTPRVSSGTSTRLSPDAPSRPSKTPCFVRATLDFYARSWTKRLMVTASAPARCSRSSRPRPLAVDATNLPVEAGQRLSHRAPSRARQGLSSSAPLPRPSGGQTSSRGGVEGTGSRLGNHPASWQSRAT
jgi:hypothetical protein